MAALTLWQFAVLPKKCYYVNMKKKSVLADEDLLREACLTSGSLKEVLGKMNLRAAGGNYKQLRLYADKFGIKLPAQDAEHFQRKTSAARAKTRVPDDLAFCENSLYNNRGEIKKRLRALGWEWICATPGCEVTEEWLGMPITLQLDHKNGVWNDNRLENLRLLCPNCHSQTDTFAGRKVR